MTRSIVLIPAPAAVAAPRFARVIRRFGRVRFLSREIGTVPMIDVDQLAAPSALLRAVRWHLARPRTPDTLDRGLRVGLAGGRAGGRSAGYTAVSRRRSASRSPSTQAVDSRPSAAVKKAAPR